MSKSVKTQATGPSCFTYHARVHLQFSRTWSPPNQDGPVVHVSTVSSLKSMQSWRVGMSLVLVWRGSALLQAKAKRWRSSHDCAVTVFWAHVSESVRQPVLTALIVLHGQTSRGNKCLLSVWSSTLRSDQNTGCSKLSWTWSCCSKVLENGKLMLGRGLGSHLCFFSHVVLSLLKMPLFCCYFLGWDSPQTRH